MNISLLLNQAWPLRHRHGGRSQQFGEDGLIGQRRGEDGRERQVNLVVFQLGQFVDEELAEGVAVNAVRAAEMIDDLRGQRARAFQFGGESFEQRRHPLNIHGRRRVTKHQFESEKLL